MRSYRDFWLWLGGLFLVLLPFPAAIAIAYYAKLTNYSVLMNRWMLASLAFFLAAFACFFCAIKGTRMPPWKKIRFPNIKVDIYGEGFANTERVIMEPGASSEFIMMETLKRYMVRIINVEEEQKRKSHHPALCQPCTWFVRPCARNDLRSARLDPVARFAP
jgi:hypothetical protein